MKSTISKLSKTYENGKLSRRDLVQGLALLAAGSGTVSAGGIPRKQHQSRLSVRQRSATIERFLPTRVGLHREQTGRE
jgi:hypothetical protein